MTLNSNCKSTKNNLAGYVDNVDPKHPCAQAWKADGSCHSGGGPAGFLQLFNNLIFIRLQVLVHYKYS